MSAAITSLHAYRTGATAHPRCLELPRLSRMHLPEGGHCDIQAVPHWEAVQGLCALWADHLYGAMRAQHSLAIRWHETWATILDVIGRAAHQFRKVDVARTAGP